MSRRDRQGCDYDAYVPDALAQWDLVLPADLVADIADAEAATRALNASGAPLVNLEGVARFLLRAESVASSKIEGLEVGPRRLLEAELLLAEGGEGTDRAAVEILANVMAMETAIGIGAANRVVALDDLLEIHRTLMAQSPTPEIGGVVRDEQNWIGGSGYNPCSASFVPPPPERVETLLVDLLRYVNGDDHPALIQAAIAHAQFETIHPFADGNGRTGRALIHVVLRRRGLAPSFVPPISLVLASSSRGYVEGLTTFRHVSSAQSKGRSTAAHAWLRMFATATTRACADAQSYAARIADLGVRWRGQLGRVRAGSSVALLIERLAGAPIISVESAAQLINRSEARTGDAVNRLVDAGVLQQRNLGRQRYRVFDAPDVVELYADFERALVRGSSV